MFPTTILLATDGSEEATRAAKMATRLSHKLDSELHIVNVGAMPSVYSYPEAAIPGPEYRDRVRAIAEEARERLEEQMEKIREVGGDIQGAHARVGRPDTEIGAELVVVGSRGLGTLRRALMGSVSNSVVRHAHGPVLVVRGGNRQGDMTTQTSEERGRI